MLQAQSIHDPKLSRQLKLTDHSQPCQVVKDHQCYRTNTAYSTRFYQPVNHSFKKQTSDGTFIIFSHTQFVPLGIGFSLISGKE